MSAKLHSRRVVVSEYTPQALSGFFAGRHLFCWVESDWPMDARIVDIRAAHDRDIFYIYWESSEFDEVPEGHVIPRRSPEFKSHFMEHKNT